MKTTLREFIKNYESGKYDDPGVLTMVDAGWYDWFSDDEELKGKLDALFPKVKEIAQSPKIDNEKVYVYFKENCTINGELYDDFKICDIETGDVIYTIIPVSFCKKSRGNAVVWAFDKYLPPHKSSKEMTFETWHALKDYFGLT